MFCKKCGFKLDEDNKFCPSCGANRELENINRTTNYKGSKNMKKIGISITMLALGMSIFFVVSKQSKLSTPSNKNVEIQSLKKNSPSKKELGLFDVKSGEDLLSHFEKDKYDLMDELGPNYSEDYYEGAKIIYYSDTLSLFYDEDSSSNIISMFVSGSVKLNGKIIDQMATFEQIEEKLGIPAETFFNEHDETFVISYDIKNYSFSFESMYEDGMDWFLTVKLK